MNVREHIKNFLLLEYNKEEVKSQVDIIYKDPNLICLIPKSQMTSMLYGGRTKWCQVSSSGFEDWSKQGLLIRFLFKSGRKIRFTYFFPQFKDRYLGDYYWANENGYHVLTDYGNPFEASPKGDRVRGTEKDILGLIKEIPEECQKRVLDFIERHKKAYEYCYNFDKEYKPANREKNYQEFLKVYNEFKEELSELFNTRGVMLNLQFDKNRNLFVVAHNPNFGKDNYDTVDEDFKSIDAARKRVLELLKLYKSEPQAA